jgi:muramidase (phage lysozyme)
MHEHGAGIRNPLFFIGVIEGNKDDRLEGRVRVRAFGIHGTVDEIATDELPWAIVAQGGYDPNVVPKVNSWVYGMFLDGRDGQQPMILGLIPTQAVDAIDPAKYGWGWIPDQDADLLSKGATPEDAGLPQNSNLARGEYIQDSYVLQQEMGRAINVPVGGSEDTWDEPGSAYDAEYPHNKVIETAKHSIEIDDTPGAERIMIHHNSGSFIQIDDRGTTTNKTKGDHYDVMDRKQHVVVGGMSTVTILGNSYVYVKGDKIEEIEGDLQTQVHGNHLLSVGGQSTINAAEQVQIRGADVKVDANVGTLSIKSAKETNISTGLTGGGLPPKYGALSIKAEKIQVDATDKLHLRGNTQVNIQSIAEMNLSAININQQAAVNWNATGKIGVFLSGGIVTDIDAGIDLAIQGGVATNIGGPIANIGSGIVNLAPPIPPRPSGASAINSALTAKFLIPPVMQKPFIPGSAVPEIAWGAGGVEAPEPVRKSTSITPQFGQGSMGSSGFSAKTRASQFPATPLLSEITAATQTAATPLLDFIGNKESEGYDDISGLVSQSLYPAKPITKMTMSEILDWQESIDQTQLSEAVGRYQIMEDTLRGYNNDATLGPGNPLYTRAGLSAGDLFSPENQDKMAIVLLDQRGLSKFIDGKLDKWSFANNLASEWASLPLVSGAGAGKSKYANDKAGNRSLTTVSAFLNVLDEVKTSSVDTWARSNTDRDVT